MASLLCILLFLALTGPSIICFAESRKELRNKEVNYGSVLTLRSSIRTNRVDPSRVIQLSWQPRVFLYKGFLTDEECDHLVSLAQSTKESVGREGDDSGNTVKKRLLTVTESLLNTDDNIIARIEERVSAWTFIPKGNSKALEITHYGLELENASYNLDYFGNKSSYSEPLLASLVIYLSNVSRGGEILFPKSEVSLKSKVWSDCSRTSDVLRPTKGNAIFFFNVHPNASPDPSSTHSRCPILEGEMWCATKFFMIRAISEGKALLELDGDECTDMDENCSRWAAIGECQRNPVFMVGSQDYYGTCRKSCNAC